MIFYKLPNIHNELYLKIKVHESEKKPEIYLSHSMSHYMRELKRSVNKHNDDWDVYKKYTNPYEYINTIPINKNKCVAKYKPLSRSYYKMIEIIDEFNLCSYDSEIINTFHLAEGPGGFIEAFCNKRHNINDIYVGMTLLEDVNDINIPTWSKSQEFLNKNKNVKIEKGIDGRGDILSVENFKHCINKYGSSKSIITGDGGFDFSADFNDQEFNVSKLLIAQTCFAIGMQKKKGHFVLKIFDCFHRITIDILYLLSSFYKDVYICKPNTSRYANSERYVVCKYFLFGSNKIFIKELTQLMEIVSNSKRFIYSLFDCNIHALFISKIEEYNLKFGQQQMTTIMNTIQLIKNPKSSEKIESLCRLNLQKCVYWCEKHNVQHNVFT